MNNVFIKQNITLTLWRRVYYRHALDESCFSLCMATLITKAADGHSLSPSGCVSAICRDDLRHWQHESEKNAVMVNGFLCPTAQTIWAMLNVEFDLCTSGRYIHFIRHTKWSGDSSYACYAIDLCEQHALSSLNMCSALAFGHKTLIWNVHENMNEATKNKRIVRRMLYLKTSVERRIEAWAHSPNRALHFDCFARLNSTQLNYSNE